MAYQLRPFAKALSASVSLSIAALLAPAAHAENVKIAFIDALSGTFAPTGQTALKNFQMVTEVANKEKWGGPANTIEMVGFDGKGSPQESLTQLKIAIDQGYHYITQGGGSGVALALVDAINKHNERNPGKEIVYLDFAALDPDLTNSKCSFWHFRFEPNSDMRMEALTSYLAKDPSIKKIYIIGQNYALGHQVSRAAKEYLKRKRPDIQIVGDDLHPIATVKDFSPYVAKIKASGADAVITGNWGNDLALLIKAAKDADLKANFYTYTAYTTGVPTAMGAAGVDRVKNVSNWNINNEVFAGKDMAEAVKKKYNEDYWLMSSHSAITMLAKAIKDTGSTDPVKVAFAMEGMTIKSYNGNVEMRKSDHQAQQPIYITNWVKTNGKDVKFDQENTGFGWKTEQKIDTFVASQPTSCQMKRPTR
ncbi:branched-chain amino acid ABC transporter substrate-binding protein [Undibacterium sp. RTI2.1]|uniref:branched-chain amino acid ABC transporter substrate-binding protein n=1 Tax=unclassified Undibacterium TaxID=2630295 RepID=UPI002AB373D8|nr:MULTISPECIES: branched-chain amino acid ABC transporter substrate-binding protein [unclassified Undibacterium]MDY7540241.1 branched-chain amino acid ABC transporter substrate-binding protein [Undibacterium sp. 5I1]MEB0031104.1 branched-chain amino acid ABC transporter substrate-binding protein [Undibacterium sp. RTI2.1]MEB0115304.1 branched-chain amino acid ABC transporter substrate-binding protein [Undibacterium sp. RTI2.2]MEB0231403.1 branched-chain amino acid ABC transporter substrate-bin